MKQIRIRELKNKLSEVLNKTKEAHITIINYGKTKTMIMSYVPYQKLVPQKTGLNLFKNRNWSDVNLEEHPSLEL